jgi:hypothetical protein
MKLEFSRQIFEKYLRITFYENLSSGSRVVPCGRAGGWRDRQTDMTKLIVAFRNFANAPNGQRKRERMSVPWMSFEQVMSVPATDALNAWPLYHVTARCYTVCIHINVPPAPPDTHSRCFLYVQCMGTDSAPEVYLLWIRPSQETWSFLTYIRFHDTKRVSFIRYVVCFWTDP